MSSPSDALQVIRQISATQRSDPATAVGQILSIALAQRLETLTRVLAEATGLVVQSGPFTGMRYVRDATAASFLLPKLLGCYEAELHGVLHDVVHKPYRAVVNIGCGEGYYAVGLARLLPSAQVYAFDPDPAAQRLCSELARLNSVGDRVVVGPACGHEQLRALAGPDTLIVCDCEGEEMQLLCPQRLPGLAVCDALVEMHDFLDPQTSRALPARFESTHEVTSIPHGGRNPYALRVLRDMSQLDQWLAVWEGRPGPTPWAWLRTRHGSKG